MSQSILSSRLRLVCGVAKWVTIAVAIFTFVMFFTENMMTRIISDHWDRLSDTGKSGAGYSAVQHIILKILATAKFMAPGLIMFATWRVMHIFHTGDPLSLSAVKALRFLGTAIMLYAVFGIVFHSIMTVALTYNNPPGTKEWSIALSNNQIITVLIGAIIWIVGHVYVQAVSAVEENRQFV